MQYETVRMNLADLREDMGVTEKMDDEVGMIKEEARGGESG